MNKIRYLFATTLAAAALAALSVVGPTGTRAQLSAPQSWAGTAGGTTTAITLSVHNVVALNDLLGVPIRFLPGGTSVGPTTLTVNLDGGGSLTPTAVKRPTSNLGLQAPSGSELVTAVMAELTFDGTEFVVTSTVDMTPVGQAVDLRQSSNTAPAGYAIEDGSCYAQATYPALFSLISTTYNAGSPLSCSGSQFAVPFSNGAMFAALDNQGANGAANRITSAGSGCNAISIILCGSQSQTLTIPQLPVFTPTGNIAISGGTLGGTATNNNALGSAGLSVPTGPTAIVATFTGNSIGSGNSHPVLNPVLLGRRAVKF